MRRNNKVTYLIFIVMILLLGLGYALLTTNLNITGTTVLKDSRWDIHLENVSVNNESVSASTPTIDTSRTTVSYSVTLNTPGDFYEFTVDCKNDGSIDGMIESFVSKLNGNPITTLPNALEYSVTYSDGTEIANNQILEAGEKETFKVHVAYKRDLEISDLPSTETSLNLTFTITYVQADASAIEVDHPHPVYTANFFDGNDYENSVVYLGHSIPAAITQYSTSQELFENWLYPFYFKHIVQNNIVLESYVEFVVTQTMVNNNPGMTEGTYALRGIDIFDYDQIEDTYICKSEYYNSQTGECVNPYYETNKQTLLSAFGSTYCNDNSSGFSCSVTGLTSQIMDDGDVLARIGHTACGYGNTYGFGGSSCTT